MHGQIVVRVGKLFHAEVAVVRIVVPRRFSKKVLNTRGSVTNARARRTKLRGSGIFTYQAVQLMEDLDIGRISSHICLVFAASKMDKLW
jgi:hypothetical protein